MKSRAFFLQRALLSLSLGLLVFILPPMASAWELEGFAGASSTQFDEVSEANTFGISARAKVNFYGVQQRGLFIKGDFRGYSPVYGDYLLGYGWRSRDALFWEVGAGLSYSLIFGPGVGTMASLGYRLSPSLFVSIPFILRLGGASYIRAAPMIGYRF